ncbi:nucleotide sugar dehydrogenase [Pelagibacterales bacterium SAG-MED09]|nr:nucleotide sugar dehydrogenase [Pelagibacterales bacterium SAG-MED09]
MKKIFPCVVGLGYVGLPVFISLKKKFQVIGFDIDKKRVQDLNHQIDVNNEFKNYQLKLSNKSIITNKESNLKKCNFFIVTVPTPINNNKIPNLRYIVSAFKTIGKYIKKDDIIFLESTVFPGTTEYICKKIIKKNKNVKFHIGYSSERINPGDKIHNISKINKVVSIKHNKKIIPSIKKVYNCISKKIIMTENIKEAELSKLIENTQRDLNIALMNELMILCHKTNLDFNEVIRLAKTKWNFLNFSPGLVGGHCLPVDPYYLSYYANKFNFKTKVTLAGRNTNNSMEKFIYEKICKKIINKKMINKKIIIAGLTYKPNVADLRNSLANKIFKRLKKLVPSIVAYDPTINHNLAKKLNIETNFKNIKKADMFIILVQHNKFKNIYMHVKKYKNKKILDFHS